MSDYLPEGVLLDIFLRLPAKSVMELRYVCKTWYSLVTDPNFISKYNDFAIKNCNNDQVMIRHYERCNMKDICTLHRNDDGLFSPYDELNLPLDSRRSSYWIIDSSHGLVCLLGFVFRRLPKHIMIWNPSLGFLKRILVTPLFGHVEEPVYGFGFDPKSNDHKVVRMYFRQPRRRSIGGGVQIVEIYALSVGKWVEITAKPPFLVKDTSPRAYLNGAVHWIGLKDVGAIPRILVLGVFDLSDETFRTLKIPDELMSNALTGEPAGDQQLLMAVMNQSLGLLHYFTQWDKSPSYDGCCIWVMTEYGVAESWTKKFRVDLRLGIAKVIGLRKNGEILLVTRHNFELVSFHPRTRRINRLGLYADAKSFYMATYMESLVLYKRSSNSISFNAATSVDSTTENGKATMEH